MKGLEATLNAVASGGTKEGSSGWMGLGAISEFGRSDHEIARLIDTAERTLQSALLHRIDEGKSRGEISADVDTRAATDFLSATFSAIKLAARRGPFPPKPPHITLLPLPPLIIYPPHLP